VWWQRCRCTAVLRQPHQAASVSSTLPPQPCSAACVIMQAAATVAWNFVEAVPHMAAMLEALAADDSIATRWPALVCNWLAVAAEVLLTQSPARISSSSSQLAAWAAAADASLRLVPTLVQLQERCRSDR